MTAEIVSSEAQEGVFLIELARKGHKHSLVLDSNRPHPNLLTTVTKAHKQVKLFINPQMQMRTKPELRQERELKGTLTKSTGEGKTK